MTLIKSVPAFPVVPSHDPPRALPQIGGEMVLEKQKRSSSKMKDEDLKNKLESSIQNALNNPEIRANPMKILRGNALR
jgi:hypothetical protein